MKRYFSIYLVLMLILIGCINNQKNISVEPIQLNNLRCELLENPIGIDVRNPKLSWQILSNQNNIKQKAYQIIVSSSLDNLNQNIGDLWDTERIISDQSVHVQYQGKVLKSNQQCFWKVKVWTENGESDWSEPVSWSMGYLYYKDWQGRWIGLDKAFSWDEESQFSRLSARYFRKDIDIQEQKIVRATAYIIGLGLYELYVNGEKIGEHVHTPTPTDYTKNVKYNVFDVTDQLSSGRNCIGVILGNGLFYTMRQKYKPYKIKSFGYPKLLFNLLVEYVDGSTKTFNTDNSWKVTSDGPIRSNNQYDGEEYDARKEIPGWNKVGFNDSKWIPAEYVQQPRGEYEAQLNENMKVMHEIKPIAFINKGSNRFILDMGQNMAGWLQIKVKGNRGEKVTMRFAESLTENGELNTAPLRDAKVTDIYTLKGGEEETWEPKFVYHGFRFVEITGYPGKVSLDNFIGRVIYDDINTVGQFVTSDSIINQVFKNAFWSINGTYKGMPIDCPQRNERMPWLGDRAIGCYGESFVLDNSRLYTKWMDDIMHTQKADGALSDVAPPFFRYYSDNMTWPGTYIMVADMLYKQYGLIDPIKKALSTYEEVAGVYARSTPQKLYNDQR